MSRPSRSRIVLHVLLTVTLAVTMLGPAGVAAAQEEPDTSVLVFSATEGFRHDSIPDGIAAVQALGDEHGFDVDATEDAGAFTEENLAQYDAVVWLSTTGSVLDQAQQAAFESYIQDGGGYAGIHSASDTHYDWDWYGDLVGAYFESHPPGTQTADVIVYDSVHPSTEMLPTVWERHDEWYDFDVNPRGDVHVLAGLDESSYEDQVDPGPQMGWDHPIAWCQEFDGGRSWYTGGGHTSESFSEDGFLDHMAGGILWAAGELEGDCSATVWDSFDKQTLAQGPDEVGEPMGMAILPDGRVLHNSRSDGAVDPRIGSDNPVNGLSHVFLTDPESGETTEIAEIPVYRFSEYGGQGMAIDPDFEDNGWVYLYYTPADDEVPDVDEAPRDGEPGDWDEFEGVAHLSRFQFADGDQPVLDLASEQVLLEVPQNLALCCHVGGDIDFDSEGNLYLSTGDDTHFDSSSNYTPIDDRETRNPGFDARRTSGNTAHLGGKVLRITPQPDGSYTVPEGNLFNSGAYDELFPDGEYDEELALPEIYAMGLRNPFRFAIDQETDALYLGDYGPDAGSADPDRGPQNTVSWHVITEPVNIGWPYCIGDNVAYVEYDFATGESGDPFDCEGGPVNESALNTGLEQLPPVTPAPIWYHYDLTPEFPQLGTGSGSPMGGPAYHYDAAVADGSDVAWPEYYDGIPLLYEWGRNWIKQIHLDDDDQVVDITETVDGIPLSQPMDMEFGPDGALYFLEYAGGFFSAASGASLSRITYHGAEGAPTPPDEPGPGGPIGELECIGFASDDFEGEALDTDRWTQIVRENPDGYRVADGALHIETGDGTDMYGGNTNAENIVLQEAPEGSWQVTTEVELDLDGSREWEQAALMVYGDDQNFVKLSFIQTPDGRNLEFILQEGGSPIDGQELDRTDFFDADYGDTVHLRITSNGADLTASWSEDGEDFTDFGRQRSLDAIDDPHVGLAAFNGQGDGNEASFEHFTLTPDPDALAETRSDDFEGDELDGCRWDRVLRYDPDKVEVSDGRLHLDVPDGDIFESTNTDPDNFILQTAPEGDFLIETSFEAPFEEQFQQAGLIVHDDDANYVKMNVVTDNPPDQDRQLRVELRSEIDDQIVGATPDLAPAPDNPDDQWWVRLQREGTTYTGWVSVDGEDWIEMDDPVENDALVYPGMGVYTLGHEQTDSVTVSFDYFASDPDEFVRWGPPTGPGDPVDPDPECGEPSIEDGYTALWDGESLDGWSMAGPGTFDVVADDDRDGTCALESVGGMGLLWHEDELGSYRFRTDFRAFEETDNSGVFVGFPDPGDDPWVAVDEGYEIQIDDFGAGDPPGADINRTGAIYSFQEPTSFPAELGEWNTLEIEVDDPMIRVWINGELVNEFEDFDGSGRDLSSGYLGLQNHSGNSQVQFRDLQVTDLDDDPAEPSVTASLDPAEPDGDNDWYVSPVTITLESDDEDATLQWRLAGEEEWITWTEPVTVDTDGVYDVEYRAVVAGSGDGSGAPTEVTSEVRNFTFDPSDITIAEGGTVTFELINGFHNVVIFDEDGDLVDGNETGTDWGTWDFVADEAGSYTFICEPHPDTMTGTLEVVAAGDDTAEEVSSEIGEVSFSLDQTPPETTASVEGEQDGDVFVDEATVTLDAEDATSGVAETHIREQGDDDFDVYDGPVTFTGEGSYTLEFRSADVAGNVEDWGSVEFEVVEDDDPTDPTDPTDPPDPVGAVCERAQGGPTFPDAPGSGHEFFIDCLAELGIVQGYADGTFGPRDDVSRGQLASFVVRSIELATGESMESGGQLFPDVGVHSAHGQAIYKLRNAGIIRGYEDGTFRPRESVTRDQTARYVVNALEQVLGTELERSGATFSDVPSGSQYSGDVDKLVTAGVIQGFVDGTFAPREPVTRGQMTRFIGNALGVLDEAGAYQGP